ncbi:MULTISPECIES: hypothetical protein [Sphingobacterium]|uniref:hypothetical protein n=1 Tax=Sphingobacterium TaxID=28453 RepID=UPI0013DAAA55|nr:MULTISPECIES: hypothetical protein [unclassified Sphingobacterium]
MHHKFHLPVLGLAFSIDSPLKVGKYGISSVVSIVDDELIENIRKYHALCNGVEFERINKSKDDARALRITAYLNLLKDLLDKQICSLRERDLYADPEVKKYFNLLPSSAIARQLYDRFVDEKDPKTASELRELVKNQIVAGSIDVNIMAKVDRMVQDTKGNGAGGLSSDALSALRGFANSNLSSSLVLSAGLNPRLYQYLSELPAFFPDYNGNIQKQVILKVSDYRSAMIQAKYLAKKGVWVSEFRVESGLNCGGHAFATEGYLLGPILEEFKERRGGLEQELLAIYKQALGEKGIAKYNLPQPIRLTVQGGIGTAAEQQFLMEYYRVDGTGWGSPFLLVPEATTVDKDTLTLLAGATASDFYISDASPLGVPFNNFRKSSAEKNRLERIEKGRPGAPCTKKYLVSNTEFTKEPICTASRKYQSKKIKELANSQLSGDQLQKAYDYVLEKTCLCEGLASSAYLKYDIDESIKDLSVAICPGPNLSYFNRIYNLEEMVSHIYGRLDLLKDVERPSMFINELQLYIQYIEKQIKESVQDMNIKKSKYIQSFVDQVFTGIEYYSDLTKRLVSFTLTNNDEFTASLQSLREKLHSIACKYKIKPYYS